MYDVANFYYSSSILVLLAFKPYQMDVELFLHKFKLAKDISTNSAECVESLPAFETHDLLFMNPKCSQTIWAIVCGHYPIFQSIVCSSCLFPCNSDSFPQCPTAHQQQSPVLSSDFLKGLRSREGENIFLPPVKSLIWLHFPHPHTMPPILVLILSPNNS